MTSSVSSGPRAVTIGVDGSSDSNLALTFAADLASHEHRPLHVVHAYDAATPAYSPVGTLLNASERHDLAERTARVLVERACRAVHAHHPTLTVEIATTALDPRQALIEAAQDSALLVVGSRGLGLLERLTLGSVGTWISQHSTCPVLVVRPAASERPELVVAATDGSEASSAALEFAFAYASTHTAPLTVLRCFPDDFHGGYGMTAAPAVLLEDVPEEQAALSTSLAELVKEYPDLDVTFEVRHRSVIECLLAASSRASLVVVGSHHRSILGALVHGAVSRAVVEHAHCNVAVVPAGRRAEAPTAD